MIHRLDLDLDTDLVPCPAEPFSRTTEGAAPRVEPGRVPDPPVFADQEVLA
jgi:hypothetical protein